MLSQRTEAAAAHAARPTVIAPAAALDNGTATMPVVYNDAGRHAGPPVSGTDNALCRAVAIATGRPYAAIAAALPPAGRDGAVTPRARRHLESLGWQWVATAQTNGVRQRVALCRGTLPPGRLIVVLDDDVTAVIDGVIHDIRDPQRRAPTTSRGRTRVAHRCVEGFFYRVYAAPRTF